MTDIKKFRRWVRELRKRFPVDYPVTVRLVPPAAIKGHFGECVAYDTEKRLSRFVVKIANNLSNAITADTLAEEWAHVLRYHMYSLSAGKNGHDSIYGAVHARIKEEWLHEEDADGDQGLPS